MKTETTKSPYIVNGNHLLGALVVDGIFNGLPLGLAKCIADGQLKMKDVKKRGWVYFS